MTGPEFIRRRHAYRQPGGHHAAGHGGPSRGRPRRRRGPASGPRASSPTWSFASPSSRSTATTKQAGRAPSPHSSPQAGRRPSSPPQARPASPTPATGSSSLPRGRDRGPGRPRPIAALAALSVSGLSPDRFLFYGFLPQKKGKKRKILQDVLAGPFPVVLFESPRRVEGDPRSRRRGRPGAEGRSVQGADKGARGGAAGDGRQKWPPRSRRPRRAANTPLIVDGKGRQAPP